MCPALLKPAHAFLSRRSASAALGDASTAHVDLAEGQRALDIGYTGNWVLEHNLKYVSSSPRGNSSFTETVLSQSLNQLLLAAAGAWRQVSDSVPTQAMPTSLKTLRT